MSNKHPHMLLDKEEGEQLVIDAIQGYMPCLSCQNLMAAILSEGNTNFCFKVYLQDDGPNTPLLFAKLLLDRARWHPDPNEVYDLQRADNEGEIMKRFGAVLGGGSDTANVPTPYFVLDVLDGCAKLLVTEWAHKTNVGLGSQFVEGAIDSRVIRKAAHAFATLNLQPVEPEWNQNVKLYMLSAFYVVQAKLKSLLEAPVWEEDEAIRACKEMGKANVESMICTLATDLAQSHETLVHGDVHPFNLLVEPKPDPIAKPNQFGDEGDLTIVDWEMTAAGSAGQDVGKFQSFPIACAMAHAVQNRPQLAYEMIASNVLFWEAYAQEMVEQGDKTERELANIFRKSLSALGFHLFVVMYVMEVGVCKRLPFEGVPSEDIRRARAAYGVVGLRFLQVSYGERYVNLSLTELRSLYRQLIENHIDALLTYHRVSTVERASFSRKETYKGFFLGDELEAKQSLSSLRSFG